MTGLTLECELLETTLMDGKTYGSMTPIDAPVTIATLDKANGELIELEARWHMSTHFCHVSHSFLLHVSSPAYISSPCMTGDSGSNCEIAHQCVTNKLKLKFEPSFPLFFTF